MTRTGAAIAAGAVKAALPDLSDDQALTVATAVIRSLREPTALMLRNAAKVMTHKHRPTLDRVSHRQKHKLRYQAMIDGALGLDIEQVRASKEVFDEI